MSNFVENDKKEARLLQLVSQLLGYNEKQDMEKSSTFV